MAPLLLPFLLLQEPSVESVHKHTSYEIRLLDEGGLPLANTPIALTDTRFGGCSPPLSLELRTNGQARFSLPSACSTRLYLHAASHDNSFTRFFLTCRGDGGKVSLNVQLKPLATLSGVLVDRDGKTPLAGVKITTESVTSEWNPDERKNFHRSVGSADASRYILAEERDSWGPRLVGRWEWAETITDGKGRFSVQVLTDLPISLGASPYVFFVDEASLRLKSGEHRKVRLRVQD